MVCIVDVDRHSLLAGERRRSEQRRCSCSSEAERDSTAEKRDTHLGAEGTGSYSDRRNEEDTT